MTLLTSSGSISILPEQNKHTQNHCLFQCLDSYYPGSTRASKLSSILLLPLKRWRLPVTWKVQNAHQEEKYRHLNTVKNHPSSRHWWQTIRALMPSQRRKDNSSTALRFLNANTKLHPKRLLWNSLKPMRCVSAQTPQPVPGGALTMDAELLPSWTARPKCSFRSQHFPLVPQQFYSLL